MTILGGRTEQLVIIASFLPRHGFTSDFLKFHSVEQIWFFHGALSITYINYIRCFPFNALTLLVWQQEGDPAYKKLGVGWSFA